MFMFPPTRTTLRQYFKGFLHSLSRLAFAAPSASLYTFIKAPSSRISTPRSRMFFPALFLERSRRQWRLAASLIYSPSGQTSIQQLSPMRGGGELIRRFLGLIGAYRSPTALIVIFVS